MNLNEVKTLLAGTIKQAFGNKKTLDKFDGTSGTLKYNGVPVNNAPVFVADDSPVGNIISFMGNTAPKDYLICDGTEYNIADYPLLVQHFINEFGSANYFGGDGTATFAVPDLRERFLKGSEEVGINEEAGLPNIQGAFYGYHYDNFGSSGVFSEAIENDNHAGFSGSGTPNRHVRVTFDASKNNSIYGKSSTVIPTNTSVLYCIKYQITQNNISKDMVNYSTEEQVIGSWINGKPLYQKTIVTKVPATKTNGTVASNIVYTDTNIELCTKIQGFMANGETCALAPSVYLNSTDSIVFFYRMQGKGGSGLTVQNTAVSYSNRDLYVTIEYTKTTDAENSFTLDMLSSIKMSEVVTDDDVNDVIGGI